MGSRVRGRAHRLNSATAVIALSAAGCGPAVEPATPEPPAGDHVAAPGPVRTFRFEALDGSVVTNATLRGRLSFVTLVASYDTASHAQVLFLRSVARRHVPRINGLIVVLEPDHHRPMVEAFAAALDVPFPVVMVAPEAFKRDEPFPGLLHVPSVLLLDPEGREVWRRIGLTSDKELEAALAPHERSLPTLPSR